MSDQIPAPVPTEPAVAPTPTVPAATATQYPDGLGDPGKRALDAEREARKAAEARLAELEAAAKAAEDEKLSELDRFRKQAQDREELANKTVSENLRLRFAMANQVPEAWVDRLKGNTAEELLADWAILQPTLTPPVDPNAPRVPAPVPNAGPQPGDPQSEEDRLYNEIYGAK